MLRTRRVRIARRERERLRLRLRGVKEKKVIVVVGVVVCWLKELFAISMFEYFAVAIAVAGTV